MNNHKLGRMANDIAAFFQAYPHEKAVAGVHDHLLAFWTPKMRATLQQMAADGDRDLSPLVVEAVTRPTSESTPAGKEAAGPAKVGEIGASDAG